MYSKEDIVKILMDRDDCTEKEAWDIVNETQNQINDVLVLGDTSEVEDILMYELGLELDYVYAFLI